MDEQIWQLFPKVRAFLLCKISGVGIVTRILEELNEIKFTYRIEMNPEKLYIQDPLDIKKKFKKFIIITGCFKFC